MGIRLLLIAGIIGLAVAAGIAEALACPRKDGTGNDAAGTAETANG